MIDKETLEKIKVLLEEADEFIERHHREWNVPSRSYKCLVCRVRTNPTYSSTPTKHLSNCSIKEWQDTYNSLKSKLYGK